MPRRTERQQAADVLERAFLVQYISELEDHLFQLDLDTASDSDDSDSDSTTDSGSSSSDSSSSSSESSSGPSATDTYFLAMAELYSQHYLTERRPISKDKSHLHLLLGEWKASRPEIFASYVRITSECFDYLLSIIRDDEVFQNNSNNPQLPVAEQLVIALYRFGHYGNAASTMKVALQFGVGYGMVHLATARVIKACCSEHFRSSSLQWPDDAEKEHAKEWVEEASGCPAWRDGWLMVDGTLVPLFRRPGWFGNVWYDRKSNYSLNVQVNVAFC